ncbi:MAG: endolytic transglycosylase MltG [Pseudomonadales bacterium]|nr:endolytic transglycosylase MltG [Pseudomonadales bacterium]
MPVIDKLRQSPRLALLLAAALLLLLVGLAGLRIISSVYGPMQGLDEERFYLLESGSNLTRVAEDLARDGYIDYPVALRLLARWQGVASNIQVGEYRLLPGMSAADLLTDMVAGDTVQYRLTLVEGWTFDQALTAIHDAQHISRQLATEVDEDRLLEQLDLQSFNADINSVEGLLFPDTYFYTRGTTDIELLRRAHQRLRQVLNSAWEDRLGALPLDSPYEALILASIIEKESAASSERGHIAGVFIRRLEQGMRLQSDPTVIYGLGSDFDGDLRRADLQQHTEFNTYRINGLPPAPIALAGADSIRAALNPLPSDYLYFVSRGDGSHYFSTTLEEHNAAVNRFQRQTSQ